MRKGEVFISNVGQKDNIEWCSFKSKRVGKVAYDIKGLVIENMAPLFASKKEQEDFIKEYS